ncbi:2-oxoacid dehydrogenases acyltransferase-domain-containing protein [Aspergillus pseudoustus]|uniref:Dihydrolipoamide acetyltransferase component of pyruvate dehydrogenase complex n=1 Tax=Aspergillus pseudoustus TaxID=1810923 RepID=A0ABR4J8L4_9EURO
MRVVLARHYWTLGRGPLSLSVRQGYSGGRLFHGSAGRRRIQPYLLADIGEGITECRIVQWFVKPGDSVEQFEAICEVQSDKASVEITSRYDGVITAIHHEVDEMAIASGMQPLLDIDVQDEDSDAPGMPVGGNPAADIQAVNERGESEPATPSRTTSEKPTIDQSEGPSPVLAAPAVRLMMKEHCIDIMQVAGTGKNGRVLKEDMLRYLSDRDTPQPTLSLPNTSGADEIVRLSPTDSQMFKVMTRALSIPHFGYAHNVDLTSLNNLRRRINGRQDQEDSAPSLSALTFILKALSQTFIQYPRLNAHLDTEPDNNAPRLIHKYSHDFGIAIDTPSGLLVPVV